MREVTKLMIKKYALNKLKYDFMGYQFENIAELSFHHLLLPHYICKEEEIGCNGYFEWNGALLVRNTAHDYLHVIEKYDLDYFNILTSEMMDMHVKGYLDYNNLKYIDDILKCFEREYSGKHNKRGEIIVKEEFTRRLIKKK